jgi:hypothetical protein
VIPLPRQQGCSVGSCHNKPFRFRPCLFTLTTRSTHAVHQIGGNLTCRTNAPRQTPKSISGGNGSRSAQCLTPASQEGGRPLCSNAPMSYLLTPGRICPSSYLGCQFKSRQTKPTMFTECKSKNTVNDSRNKRKLSTCLKGKCPGTQSLICRSAQVFVGLRFTATACRAGPHALRRRPHLYPCCWSPCVENRTIRADATRVPEPAWHFFRCIAPMTDP